MNVGNVTFEAEGVTTKEVFKELAVFQEIFQHANGPDGQGARLVVRTVTDPKNPKKEYEYFEMRSVTNPKLRLDFGQKNDGGDLFPKRKDSEGNWYPNDGWHEYKPE